MKRIALCVLIGGVIALSSCKKDEEVPVPASTLTIGGTTYDLANAYVQDYGSADCDGCKDYDVWLTTDGLVVGSNGVTGMGEFVYLDLNSSNLAELGDGTYTFSLSRLPETIIITQVGTGCEVVCDGTLCTLECNSQVLGVTGTVTVLKSGENYRIDFDLTLDGGGKATGTYFGMLDDVPPFPGAISSTGRLNRL